MAKTSAEHAAAEPAERAAPEPSEAGAPDSRRDEVDSEKPVLDYEEKYKRALADYANLERRTALDVRNKINEAIDGMARDFLEIYDEFALAREAYRKAGLETSGLDSVLRNAEAMLKRRDIEAIKSVGRAFDPSLHEALSSKTDPDLDEQTVTKELRKGYMTRGRVIRPALVEISTKGGAN